MIRAVQWASMAPLAKLPTCASLACGSHSRSNFKFTRNEFISCSNLIILLDNVYSKRRVESSLHFLYISSFKFFPSFQVIVKIVNSKNKTAIETATLLLRIDDIVSGTKRADGQEGIGAVGAE